VETGSVNGTATQSSSVEVVERVKRRRFTIEEKRRILAAADACERGELGALLGREGIFSSSLTPWRACRDRGDFDLDAAGKRAVAKADTKALERRNAVLERENRKLNRRLQRAELIMDIQKKLRGSWGSTSRAARPPRPIDPVCMRAQRDGS